MDLERFNEENCGVMFINYIKTVSTTGTSSRGVMSTLPGFLPIWRKNVLTLSIISIYSLL